DPNINHNAKKFDKLSFKDVLEQELGVMDSTAASLCKDNKIPILVFNINVDGNIRKAVLGENVGTVVGGEVND
ncbi:MAG: UMP kinase, partial [Clostridiales bacterium]